MNIVRGFLTDLEVIFLDEPTLGLDVGASRDVRRFGRNWAAGRSGRTMLLTTHYMAEADELWAKLTEGGEPSQCGWLKDKFGLSWQIIPAGLSDLLADPDPARAQRAMQAMLQMSKIDLEELIRHAKDRGSVWFATHADVVRFARANTQ